MSVKRQATTDLNHENWDQDDPSEHEEMGSFKTASKDVLEKRVIKTAKRRVQDSGALFEPKKSVFSGFGGFNKAQPSSFDFLSNLTNGNKATDGPGTTTSTTSSSLFSSSAVTSPSSGIFSIPVTSSPPSKSMFGMPTPQTSSLFGGPSVNTTEGSSLFTATKTNPTLGNSSFKTQSTSLGETGSNESTPKSTNTLSPQIPSGIFGTLNTNTNKSLFSTTNSPTSVKTGNKSESKGEEKDDKKLKYYAKLKGLNESVSDWIKKHVEETPLCILTPIFKDYEKYVKEIQDEYQGENEKDTDKQIKTNITETKPKSDNVPKSFMGIGASNTTGFSLFDKSSSKPSFFGSQNTTANDSSGEKSSGFAFGVNTSSTNSSTTVTSGGFSFGVTTSTMSTNTSSSPFTLGSTATATTASANGTAPFSFGLGKPFSFSPNVQQPAEQGEKNETNEEDEPPKVEFTPVVEDNSVFDKRCKIFVKKDGNFVDKGVGTLYIKKIEESDKHQLLVRANTNLGNVLLNLILASGIPTQRLGKNNVMLVCIPTPDAKPPPTPVLIRVKTSEEADDLLETLNKYKT